MKIVDLPSEARNGVSSFVLEAAHPIVLRIPGVQYGGHILQVFPSFLPSIFLSFLAPSLATALPPPLPLSFHEFVAL